MEPTPVFLPGEPHGQRSLVGYIVHGVAKESDTTERLNNNKPCDLDDVSKPFSPLKLLSNCSTSQGQASL